MSSACRCSLSGMRSVATRQLSSREHSDSTAAAGLSPMLHMHCTCTAHALHTHCTRTAHALHTCCTPHTIHRTPHTSRALHSRPSYLVMPMLRASLELLAATPQRAIAEAVGPYTRELGRRAAALGFRVPPHHAPCIVGLHPAAHMPSAEAIVQALSRRAPPVVVGARFGAVRLAARAHHAMVQRCCTGARLIARVQHAVRLGAADAGPRRRARPGGGGGRQRAGWGRGQRRG